MPRMAKALHEQLISAAYNDGVASGKSMMREQLAAEMKTMKANADLEMTKAVKDLIEQSGKILSRAGYMLGKLEDKPGW